MMSNVESEGDLESIAWRKAREEWGCEMEVRRSLVATQ